MKKIMLHLIMPNQISGPNTSAKIISNSFLNKEFEFGFLQQNEHAMGRINLKLIINLYKQIKLFKPDIIHLSGLQSSGFHAMIAAKLSKIKVILAVRGFSGDTIALSRFKRFVFNKIIEPFTLSKADIIYTVCNEALNNPILQKYKKNIIGCIHNPAPRYQFTGIKKLRNELSLPEDSIIITSVGRIIYDKGFTYLSRAIPTILNKYNKSIFIIIGEGLLLNELKMQLHEFEGTKLFFLGKRTDVLQLLEDSDIFVFPTLHENLSNALLEASVTRNAVIATNVGGNPDVIINNYNGLLVKPKDSEDLVESISRYIDDPQFRKEMINNNYEYVTKKFSQESIFSTLRDVYLGLLE